MWIDGLKGIGMKDQKINRLIIQRSIVRVVGVLVVSISLLLLSGVLYLVSDGRVSSERLVIGSASLAGLVIGRNVISFKRWARNLCIPLLIGFLVLVGFATPLWQAAIRSYWVALPTAGYCLFCLCAIPLLAFAKLEETTVAGTKQGQQKRKKKKPRGKRQKR